MPMRQFIYDRLFAYRDNEVFRVGVKICIIELIFNVLNTCLGCASIRGHLQNSKNTTFMAPCVTFGVIPMIGGFAFSGIMRTHVMINPIFTLAAAIRGQISVHRAFWISFVQYGGSIIGCELLRLATPDYARETLNSFSAHGHADNGTSTAFCVIQPAHNVTTFTAFSVEFSGSFGLVILFCGISDPRLKFNNINSVVLGMVTTGLMICSYQFSGASFNPARSLAPAVITYEFDYLLIYMVAQYAACLCGTLLYSYLSSDFRLAKFAARDDVQLNNMVAD